MELTPKTRKEVFLAAAGGQDVTTPTPITREEVFLDEIAKGGGGSSLPSTETASAGDVLSLDDNKEPQWATPSGGGGVLVVNMSESGEKVVCDKTATEILEAYQSGLVLFAEDSNFFYSCIFAGFSEGIGYVFMPASSENPFIAQNGTDYPQK